MQSLSVVSMYEKVFSFVVITVSHLDSESFAAATASWRRSRKYLQVIANENKSFRPIESTILSHTSRGSLSRTAAFSFSRSSGRSCCRSCGRNCCSCGGSRAAPLLEELWPVLLLFVLILELGAGLFVLSSPRRLKVLQKLVLRLLLLALRLQAMGRSLGEVADVLCLRRRSSSVRLFPSPSPRSEK